MSDTEFRERFPPVETVQTSAGPLPVTPEAKALRKGNELARLAHAYAYQVRAKEPDPAKWGFLIEQADAEIRDLVRELLRQRYRTMQRERRGKKSVAGDAAMAELGAKYGKA